MASIFKPKGSKKYVILYFDEHGKRRKVIGATDKGVTERLARDLENKVLLRREGVIDARDEARRAHEARPVADHLADWHADLVARGVTSKQANQNRTRAGRVIELAKARRLSDLTPSSVQAALGAVRGEGLALRSVHHYTRVIKSFSRWLHRDGRTKDDVLAHVAPPKNPEGDPSRRRRALGPEEAARLVQAAENGPIIFRMTGADRAMLYRLALGSGLRAAELASLAPESFRLDDDPPAVVVAAGYSKRRREDVQPIRSDLAELLRPWIASKPSGEPLFRITSYHTAEMIRRDLAAAGIPYETDSGVIDFHALRHSFVTSLARSNAPVKVIQSLARHSTPVLTLGTYAHVGLADQTAALDALPGLASNSNHPTTEAAALAATGTDGKRTATGSAPSLALAATEADTLPRDSGEALAVLKTAEAAMSPGVRIPPPPLRQLATRTESARLTATLPMGYDLGGNRPPADPEKQPPRRAATPKERKRLPTATENAPYCYQDCYQDSAPDLAALIDAWPSLPEPIRAAIVAMVRASMQA